VRARFDAVFVATGAWREEEVPIPGAGLLHSGLGFLAGGSRRRPGEACVVIGGGNTAVDTARVLHRLGAAVTVVYEGTGRSMPALREGYLRAMKEGITFRFGTRPVAVAPDGEGVTLELEEIATGTRESVACDAAFSAPGELADRRVLDGLLAAGGGAVFAGGDLVSGPATVVEAIAAGRLAAVAIDEHLGARYPEPGWLGGSADDVVGIDEVNAAYLPDRARVREERPANEDPFAEETLTLAVDDALAEIERCLSCGYCNECGTCLVLCPDAAIHWEDGPVIDYDHCKGCGICVFECPGGAMVYVAEREAAHA
jgi:Pyruvate/2-oxoacid:ferredoxin oxidoreductase delta subunit